MIDFKKLFFYSLFGHALLILFFILDGVFFSGDDLVVQHAIRVDFIGRPDKLPLAPPPADEAKSKKEEAPTSPKASPKPPEKPVEKPVEKIPAAKTIPKKSSTDLSQKQNQALSKLKELSAIDKLEQQMKSEKPKPFKYKGSEISTGRDLRGVSKLEAEAYFHDVEAHVHQLWSLPEWLAQKEFRAQVKIRFDENGKLISQEITKSSGNDAFDEQVLSTVQKSLPLPPPPEKFVRLLKSEGLTLAFPE